MRPMPGVKVPIATIRSASNATSAIKAAAPLPSITLAPKKIRSYRAGCGAVSADVVATIVAERFKLNPPTADVPDHAGVRPVRA